MKRATTLGMAATLLLAGSFAATAQTKSADEQTLRQYRLTASTLSKVAAATRAMAKAAETDPRFQAQADAKRELDTLRKKEGPTDAEQKRIETLEKQVEAENIRFIVDNQSEIERMNQEFEALNAKYK